MVKHHSYFSVQGCETVRENNKLELVDRGGDCCITSWTEQQICTFTKRYKDSVPLFSWHIWHSLKQVYVTTCCAVTSMQVSPKSILYMHNRTIFYIYIILNAVITNWQNVLYLFKKNRWIPCLDLLQHFNSSRFIGVSAVFDSIRAISWKNMI